MDTRGTGDQLFLLVAFNRNGRLMNWLIRADSYAAAVAELGPGYFDEDRIEVTHLGKAR